MRANTTDLRSDRHGAIYAPVAYFPSVRYHPDAVINEMEGGIARHHMVIVNSEDETPEGWTKVPGEKFAPRVPTAAEVEVEKLKAELSKLKASLTPAPAAPPAGSPQGAPEKPKTKKKAELAIREPKEAALIAAGYNAADIMSADDATLDELLKTEGV